MCHARLFLILIGKLSRRGCLCSWNMVLSHIQCHVFLVAYRRPQHIYVSMSTAFVDGSLASNNKMIILYQHMFYICLSFAYTYLSVCFNCIAYSLIFHDAHVARLHRGQYRLGCVFLEKVMLLSSINRLVIATNITCSHIRPFYVHVIVFPVIGPDMCSTEVCCC